MINLRYRGKTLIIQLFQKIFGTRNNKELKKYNSTLDIINNLEETYTKLSDKELKQEFKDIQYLYNEDSNLNLKEKLAQVFAIVREASIRTLNMRPYDVQILGAMVLNDGKISEMKTGEGKTLVATIPAILNTLGNKSVHIVTVNDYLASRDAESMSKLYDFFDLSIGVVTSDTSEEEKHLSFGCDIVYGTNNEFAFSYLKDNMRYAIDEISQKEHHFAIVDEVDSILIDEARTPLIISGPVNSNMKHYAQANKIAKELKVDVHFEIDEKNKTIQITEDGIKEAEKQFDIKNLYDLENSQLSHHIDQALKANYLFSKNIDYIIKDKEVVIVDEFTGRLSEGRRFSEGLHQALESKENVDIQEESQTLADISFQNYFRLYKKLSGMTGTAQTEATEFIEIYGLDVISIPTNKPIIRDDKNDLIYASKEDKFEAVIKDIKSINKKGQPILVGTTSIEQSEELHLLLKKEKLPHTVLNAKNHTKEAQIIENAGILGAITIATNMAGRGVDIKINEEVEKLGGLCIIGTERHESRRIDNQLRGRSGRQGDRGVSKFYLSLEDNLLRIFGSDKIKSIMIKLGIKKGEHIDSTMVTKAVENAQKKVENMNFESRKHLLEYDDVANQQRQVVYKFRRELLEKSINIKEKIKENITMYVDNLIDKCDMIANMSADDLNIEKLKAILKEELKVTIDFEITDYDQLKSELEAILWSKYNKKINMFSSEESQHIESVIYLQVLDNLWREHLHQMDILKTGISLRGYNQKDPLVEYKKESFHLFEDLIYRVKIDSFKTLFIVELREEDAHYQQQENETNWYVSDVMAPGENPIKVGRNETCPCGSGRKFKQCHGRSKNNPSSKNIKR
jgi:preprotein translocase subunit SecA